MTYGILIKAFGKLNDLTRAFQIFNEIQCKNLKMNEVTYGCLLNACVKNNRLDLAIILMQKIKEDNISLNTILYTTLIKGFCKERKINEAMNIFIEMKKNPKTYPNIITYNCIIDGFIKINALYKAEELFNEMTIFPDLITFSTIIKGFIKFFILKLFFFFLIQKGYCKSGNIEKGFSYLLNMIEKKIFPDEALFNLILENCYLSNKSEFGLNVYEKMQELNISPSQITYSILIKVNKFIKFNFFF